MYREHRRSQGVQWVQVHPRAREKKFGGRAEFMEVSCKCTRGVHNTGIPMGPMGIPWGFHGDVNR